MSENRAIIGKQLEKSLTAGSVIRTNGSNEQEYVAPGANGTVLTVVSGTPQWAALPATSFSITDTVTTEVVTAGDTVTFAAGQGMTVAVSATDTVTTTARLSTDANNGVVFGSDGGLYFNTGGIIASGTWLDATNEIQFTLINGSNLTIPVQDLIGTWLADFVIAGNTGTDTINNHETLTVIGATGSGITTTVTANQIAINYTQPTKEQFLGLTTGTTVTLGATPSYVHAVYRNGLYQMEGASNDYTISGTTVTFNVAFGASGGGAGVEQVEVVYGV